MKRRTLVAASLTLATIATIATMSSVVPRSLHGQRPTGTAGRAQEVLPGPATTWSLAAVGDAIITRRVMPFDNPADPRFQDMVRVIREADAAMVNLEISLFRLVDFSGWPEVENGGNWELGPPEAASDLKQMGFDLYNRANNHTTDYGVEGMRVTNRLLDELGLVHAGSGMDLGAASRPGYLETPKGRVAFIGLATSFTPMSRAGASRPDLRGRPGMNALRLEQSYEADPATFEALRTAAAAFEGGFGGGGGAAAGQDQLRILGQTIRRGTQSRVVTTVNASDEARILREIRNASDLADYVVVTSHTHQSTVVPPTWLSAFIKKCLDAGAVTFVIHGPHQLRPIEIYKGKPIFYSLGNFIFQNETIDPMPSDNYERFGLADTALASDLYNVRFRNGTSGFPASNLYYESVIAVPTFRGKELVELRLYPIDMGQKAPRSQRGTPRMANETTSRAVIERLATMSEPLGTKIVYQNGIGIWRSGNAALPENR